LPLSISDDRENARLTQMLLRLDERDDLTPEEESLAEVLTLLIEDYEEKRYTMPRVSPNESLKALMDDRVLKHKDIWPVLGNKGAATEILNGRRSISKDALRPGADELGSQGASLRAPRRLGACPTKNERSRLLNYRINYGVEQRFAGDPGLPAVQGEPRPEARQ